MVKTNEVTGKTLVCGIIGDPVEHSVSPAMHNAAFRKLGLDYIYLPFRVKPENLEKAINGMRVLQIRGLSVTLPHKVAVMQYLDEIDPLAAKIEAVNTIVNENGKLKGYNTDAAGFIQALKQNGTKLKDSRVIILGAGGAARALAFALADNGAEITILNRKQELDWAVALAVRIGKAYNSEISALELSTKNLKQSLAGADILVNATSVGMSPKINETLVPVNLWRPGLTVFDVIYNPVATRLLIDAEKAGAKTIGGLEMLVGQGTVAFKLWTGEKAPEAIMKRAALEALRS